jgi:hypothetical protein
MPRWWAERNGYQCQYYDPRYWMHNEIERVELHNGRFACRYAFNMNGGWTSPKTGKHYFSKAIGQIEEKNFPKVKPPRNFDALAEAEYELFEEVEAADAED